MGRNCPTPSLLQPPLPQALAWEAILDSLLLSRAPGKLIHTEV